MLCDLPSKAVMGWKMFASWGLVHLLSDLIHSTDLVLLRRLESIEPLGSGSGCSRRRRHKRDMVTTAMIAEDLLETGNKTCRFLALVVRLLSNAIAAYASAATGVFAHTVFEL